jgi:pimeloyl-ACP methyl ester carboxylesterase
MPALRVNGVELHYQESGDGPETIVFSHSYLLDSSHFRPQIDILKTSFRCVAFDHRGHGGSEKARTGYDMENLYTDAVGFIEAVGRPPCHFVGLSTGGYIGVRLGYRRPDLLKSLVLMDTSADADRGWPLLQYRFLLFLARFLGARFVAGQAFPFLFGRAFREDPARGEEASAWLELIAANDRNSVIQFGKGIFARRGVYEEIASIRTPTLVIVGQEDVSTPVSTARRLAQRIPECELVIIPDAGHICTIESPEAVNKALTGFLRQHAAV